MEEAQFKIQTMILNYKILISVLLYYRNHKNHLSLKKTVKGMNDLRNQNRQKKSNKCPWKKKILWMIYLGSSMIYKKQYHKKQNQSRVFIMKKMIAMKKNLKCLHLSVLHFKNRIP